MINEHVTRIENCPAVHDSTRIESPAISSHSIPCKTSVSYWQKWVSPDELPCRDIEPPTPTRSLPRRTRDRAPCDSVARSRRPCVQKRKSCGRETEETKKPRRESRKRERCPATERELTPRSTSPCYNLPITKPSYKPTRRQTKYKTSPTQSPTNVCGESRLSTVTETSVRTSPNDCKPKPTDYTDKKVPCRKLDTVISTQVPQASLHDKDPCHNKVSTSPAHDSVTKFIPCSQQSNLQQMTEDRHRPCRQLKPLEAIPQTTVLEGKAHSRCRETELSNTTGTFDLPKELPCKQHAYTVAAPIISDETHKPEITSSQIQNPHTSRDDKPCKDAMQMEKRSAWTEPRASSAERKCINQLQTDEHTTTQLDASNDEKLHGPTQATEYAKLYKKCSQVSKPSVSDIEELPKIHTVPAYSQAKRTGQFATYKPCDSLKTSEKPVISVNEKPCGQNIAEESLHNKRRQRRRRNEDNTSKEDSAVTTSLIREQAILTKPKDCKQDSALKAYGQRPLPPNENMFKRETPAEHLQISETTYTGKPCKNGKVRELVTKTTQEETETKKTLMTEYHKTQQPTSFSREKPCKKNATIQSDKITAREQLIEGRGIKKNATAETSDTKEPKTPNKEKPCKKKAVESHLVTRPDGLREQENKTIQNVATRFGEEKRKSIIIEKKPCREKRMQQESLQAKEFTEEFSVPVQKHSPVMKDMDKQKPCKPKTEAKVPITTDQAPAHKTKPCKEKQSLEYGVHKQPTEETAVQLASITDKEENRNQFIMEQPCDEVQEQRARCSADVTDSVIAWMSQTSSLLSGQNEASSSKQALQEPCLSATESTANEQITEVIQAYMQQVAVPVQGAESHEAGEEEQSSASYSPTSDAERCGCPDATEKLTFQKTKQDVTAISESEPVQKKVTEARNGHEVNDVNQLTSAVEVSSLSEKLKRKCWHMSPDQTDDNNRYNRVQNETPDEQHAADKTPCQKSRMPTSDQSVVSTTRLIGRCRQERILKQFKYTKKLPCKSALLPDSSISIQSGSSGLSYYPSIDDGQLSDSESNKDMKKVRSEISDSHNSKQLQAESDRHQNMSASSKDQVLYKNLEDQDPVVVSDTHSPVEVEKLTEMLESADLTNIYSTKMTKTVDDVLSFTTDPDVTRMRKVQSDDHDVMTRRQNLSSEVVMRCSEPSVDVSDSWAQAVIAKTSRSKTVRRDSGPEPTRISKPLAVPTSVVEDIPTPLGWNSSDNPSLEIVLQANVSTKLDSIPEHQHHETEDGHSYNSGRKVDSGRTPAVRSRQRKVPDKGEEDADNSWDSVEESMSEMSSRPHVASSPFAAKCCQDTDNRGNSNCCNRGASEELSDTDW